LKRFSFIHYGDSMRYASPLPFLLILWSLVFAVPAFADNARFQENGNGAVLDTKTGLMWQKTDSYHELKHGLNWYQALQYVDKKNAEKFAGYNDWRLPSMEEFRQLWTADRPLRSKDNEPIGLPAAFAGGGSYYLWSGDERNLDHAWYFGLGQREDYFNLKDLGDLDQGVKLVRDHKR